jgi:hypothetical protein
MMDGLFKRLREGNFFWSSKEPNANGIFSLTSAYITLETKLELISTSRCGICIQNVSGKLFSETIREVQEFLKIGKREFETEHTLANDQLGYLWIVVEGKSIEDTLVALNGVADTIEGRGFRDHMLAAIFEFRKYADDHAAYHGSQYLIYNYKRANFYPFVPLSNKEKRLHDLELKIMSVISKEVPWENDMSVWYPMWDMPFDNGTR